MTWPHNPAERVYIAGPMSGYKDFNFPAFDECAAYVRGLGWDAVSPAEHDRKMGFQPGGMKGTDEELVAAGVKMKDALRWDIGVLIDPKTTGIMLLKGWVYSKGALMEHDIARAIGLKVWSYTPRVEARLEEI